MSHVSWFLAAAEGAEHHTKTAFYIAGGALAAWAVLVSLVGITRPDFPERVGGARLVMALSALLVVGAMSTAVITS